MASSEDEKMKRILLTFISVLPLYMVLVLVIGIVAEKKMKEILLAFISCLPVVFLFVLGTVEPDPLNYATLELFGGKVVAIVCWWCWLIYCHCLIDHDQ